MTSYDGVGYTNKLTVEELAEQNLLRTEDAASIHTLTRAGGISNDDTYLLEPLLQATRELQYTSNNASTLEADYNNNISGFLKFRTLTQPVTFESFASDFVDFQLAALPPYNPANLSTNTIDDIKARLAVSLDLVTRANLGLFRNSQDLDVLTDAISPPSSTVPNLSTAGAGNIFSAVRIWASQPFASKETTDHTSVNTTTVPNSNWGIDNFSTLDGFPSNVLADISERAFSDFFTNIAPPGTSLDASQVLTKATDYFVRFAHLPDFINVVAAFTSGLTDAQQASVFKNFVINLYYNPANSNAFRLSADIGPFIDKMSANYLAALTGSTTNVNSSVSGSFPKVKILQRIYALIVEMIGIIQEVTASQSEQLKLMTQQQSEMTSLMNDIHVFTSGDGSEIDSTDTTSQEQTVRDSVNQVGTAWTDTIRANRDFIQNAAKSYQSNINSSNDAVNQQASMATSFIQELSTLLGAIYR